MNGRRADPPDVLIRLLRVKAIEPDNLRVGATTTSHQHAGDPREATVQPADGNSDGAAIRGGLGTENA